MVQVVVIAGTHSGVGKTWLSVGIMAALRQRGLVVQPFKVGPDFLDPQHHTAACGRASVNLDGWMLNRQQVLDSFRRHTADADVAVVEGVMGLYDSRDGASDDGSTAQIAKWLGAPVVLVVDCWAMARSAAALVKGYAEFDPELQLAGVLLNKVGGAAHGVWLSEALAAAWAQQRLQRQVHVLGCIPKADSVAVPERHLGLTMPHEQNASSQHKAESAASNGSKAAAAAPPAAQQEEPAEGPAAAAVPAYLARLAEHVAQHVDLDLLLQVAGAAEVPLAKQAAAAATAPPHQQQRQQQQQLEEAGPQQEPQSVVQQPDAITGGQHAQQALLPLSRAPGRRCRIAVARDEAFCFYYQDNLALLSAAGADLVFLSPLHSAHLPAGISGICFGGGYPELHGQQLSSNSTLLAEVRQWGAAGGVVYAECGGLIYLCKGLHQSDTTTDTSSSKSNSKPNGGSISGGGSSGSGGRLVPLVGLLPFEARMGGMKMGYVEVEVLPGNPLFPAGTHVRGQLYHFSEVVPCQTAVDTSNSSSTSSGRGPTGHANGSCGQVGCAAGQQQAGGCAGQAQPAVHNTYRLTLLRPGAEPSLEGYAVGNVLASYVHLHWGGCPELAAALVDKCSSSSTPLSGSSGSSGSSPLSGSSGSGSGSGSSKIVSLLPSGTEIVYALGLQDRLVGVSGFCDWPPAARSKACAVRSLIDIDAMTSSEIEEAMQAFKAAGQSPFEVDADLLAREQPGLILTQEACPTCDADASVVWKAVEQAGLSPNTTQVLVLQPQTLADVLNSITTIGAAAGVADRAQQLVEQLQVRLQAVAAALQANSPEAAALTVAQATVAAGQHVPDAGSRQQAQPGAPHTTVHSALACTPLPEQQQQQQAPRVLSLEGLNPLVLGGQWLPDVKLAAGAVDASGQQPGDAPARITWEQVLSYAPDVLLLCPCSRSPAAAMPDVTQLVQRPGFSSLPAVTAGRVYVVDHSYFSRPGPRLVDGVELLHKLIWDQAANSRGQIASCSKSESSSWQHPAEVPGHVDVGQASTGRVLSEDDGTCGASAAGSADVCGPGADGLQEGGGGGADTPSVLQLQWGPDGAMCWVPL